MNTTYIDDNISPSSDKICREIRNKFLGSISFFWKSYG